MAFRRYRRIRRVPRIRRRRFRGVALRKVKRDILKCNFPTKVKFIGLPEKKTMFLTEHKIIHTAVHDVKIDDSNVVQTDDRTLYLYPTRCKNFQTLIKDTTLEINNSLKTYNLPSILSNWDKFCVTAIYIKIQPKANVYDGSAGKTIVPVQCYYSMNNNVIFDKRWSIVSSDEQSTLNIQNAIGVYNQQMLIEKPVFTFNSNEHFTFVLKAPQTMQTDTPVVHKKYTWWSIVDQALIANGDTSFSGGQLQNGVSNMEDEEIEPEENDALPFSTPLKPFRSKELPAVHCGHLFFYTEPETDVQLDVTINYKIALKG